MAHITRAAGKFIPVDFLEKACSETTSFGLSAVMADGKSMLVRSENKHFPVSEVDAMQRHEKLRGVKTLMHLGREGELSAEDLQPFVIAKNDEGNPIIVACLDGDFSIYSEEDSGHTDEFLCVQKDIIPRVQKLLKYMKGDVSAVMQELQDPLTSQDFCNCMSGPNGSITFFGIDGTCHTISVAGDSKQYDAKDWWTSDRQDYSKATPAASAAPKSMMDDIASAMGGSLPAASPAPAKPSVPAVGGKNNKPQAKTPVAADKKAAPAPAAPAGAPQPQPAPGSGKTGAPEPAKVPAAGGGKEPDYSDPETELTLRVPKNFPDPQSKYKWVKKRMPQQMFVPEAVKGLVTITLQRKHANHVFLQDFVKQEGLPGLGAVRGIGENQNPNKAKPKLPAPKLETPKTETAPAPTPAADPKVSPKVDPQPETAPAEKVGDTPSVIAYPTPALSPEQTKRLTEYTERANVKELASDRNGHPIANPENIEAVEKAFESLKKQTGGKVDIYDIAKWPLALHLTHNQEDPSTGAHVRFWLALELNKTLKMLDELTGSKGNKTVEEQKATHVAASQHLRPQVRPKVKPMAKSA